MGPNPNIYSILFYGSVNINDRKHFEDLAIDGKI
jgi:hypothetical protein